MTELRDQRIARKANEVHRMGWSVRAAGRQATTSEYPVRRRRTQLRDLVPGMHEGERSGVAGSLGGVLCRVFVMGLGPHGDSLLDRTGQPAQVWRDPFAMQMEQIDRAEQRRLKAIWHASRHRKPPKPEAPVTPSKKEKGRPRYWLWVGEDIPSKALYGNTLYLPEAIRQAGFKLPKIGGKSK